MCLFVDAAWKHIIFNRSATRFKPSEQACPAIGHQFKLDWPASFLLNDQFTPPNVAPSDECINLEADKVATEQFAVDGKVKQSAIP